MLLVYKYTFLAYSCELWHSTSITQVGYNGRIGIDVAATIYLYVGMFLPGLPANDAWSCRLTAWQLAGSVTDPFFTDSLLPCPMDQRGTSLAQQVPTLSSIAYFMRLAPAAWYIYLLVFRSVSNLVSHRPAFLSCSLMKHTISLIWFVGEAIPYMIAPPSSGFSG